MLQNVYKYIRMSKNVQMSPSITESTIETFPLVLKRRQIWLLMALDSPVARPIVAREELKERSEIQNSGIFIQEIFYEEFYLLRTEIFNAFFIYLF